MRAVISISGGSVAGARCSSGERGRLEEGDQSVHAFGKLVSWIEKIPNGIQGFLGIIQFDSVSVERDDWCIGGSAMRIKSNRIKKRVKTRDAKMPR